MKRIASLILICAVMVINMTIAMAESDNLLFLLKSTEDVVQPGAEFEVVIRMENTAAVMNLNNVNGITSFVFRIKYDTDLFEPVATDGVYYLTALENQYVTNNTLGRSGANPASKVDLDVGVYYIEYNAETPAKLLKGDDSDIIKLKLKLKDNVSASKPGAFIQFATYEVILALSTSNPMVMTAENVEGKSVWISFDETSTELGIDVAYTQGGVLLNSTDEIDPSAPLNVRVGVHRPDGATGKLSSVFAGFSESGRLEYVNLAELPANFEVPVDALNKLASTKLCIWEFGTMVPIDAEIFEPVTHNVTQLVLSMSHKVEDEHLLLSLFINNVESIEGGVLGIKLTLTYADKYFQPVSNDGRIFANVQDAFYNSSTDTTINTGNRNEVVIMTSGSSEQLFHESGLLGVVKLRFVDIKDMPAGEYLIDFKKQLDANEIITANHKTSKPTAKYGTIYKHIG